MQACKVHSEPCRTCSVWGSAFVCMQGGCNQGLLHRHGVIPVGATKWVYSSMHAVQWQCNGAYAIQCMCNGMHAVQCVYNSVQ